MKPEAPKFLITCEHGGNRIPPRYQSLFTTSGEMLASHRGYDPGALILAKDLATALHATLIAATTSRLVVDLNRSVGHPRLHGPALRDEAPALKRDIVARYYLPYRRKVESCIAAHLARGERLIHISSHSFTPVLEEEVRQADIGLLYDPARPLETALCQRWRMALKVMAPDLRVRRNYPYTGTSDGFCRSLRLHFPAGSYVGVELEINQKFVQAGGQDWRRLRQVVVKTLARAAADLE